MGHVFHRDPRHEYPVAVAGDGVYLYDRDGNRYLDASGGAAVSCLGHSDRAVIEAIERQLAVLPYAHTSFFTNEPMEALAAVLIEGAPPPLEKVYFTSGGSEAMEAALKLGRQYFVEKGEPERMHVIGRRQSAPLLFPATHVSPCYAYRGQRTEETESAYATRLAAELESEIERLGGDTVMAFVAETVAGATLGAVPPLAGYFKRVREVCDRHGVLLILDEVMCGMGRCGSMWAFAPEGVVPDMVTIANGLGAGYQPIGAVVVAKPLYEAIVQGSGFFQHGHTYVGHAAACAGALAVQQRLKGGLLDQVGTKGAALERALRHAFGGHPHVGDIRGRGLFWALELVRDRATKAPFDPALRVHARVKQAALRAGLLCYPMGGTVDGTAGDHILLAPPFIFEPAHVEELAAKLTVALREALINT